MQYPFDCISMRIPGPSLTWDSRDATHGLRLALPQGIGVPPQNSGRAPGARAQLSRSDNGRSWIITDSPPTEGGAR
jgi:hypothetical protein